MPEQEISIEEVSIGVPSDPPTEKFTEDIAAIIRDIEEIAFAFLPEMYIPGQMTEPSLVLLIVTDAEDSMLHDIIGRLFDGMSGVVPEDSYLDVLPIKPDSDSELLRAAIKTGCLIEINDQTMFKRCHNANFKD